MKKRFGLRDTEHAHKINVPQTYWGEGNTTYHGVGDGTPYERTAATVYAAPIVESGASGLIKITQDITVPNTIVGNSIDWTTTYSPSVSTKLTVFSYQEAIDTSKALNGKSNFFLQDVQIFIGTTLTGSTNIGPVGVGTGAKVTFQIETIPNAFVAWSVTNKELTAATGRMSGVFNDPASPGGYSGARIIGGANYGETAFVLTGSCTGSSPANLTSGRIRLVMVGYEI